MSDHLFPAGSMPRLLLGRLRTFNPNFNASAYLETFKKLKTNLDRVNYVYKDMIKCDLFPYLIEEGKDDSKSEVHRKDGDRAFGMGDFREALRLYTCSIATARTTEILALAYANRSATLYKVGRYQNCLVDIERAIAANYPDNLKPKLIGRRNNAERMLNSSRPLERYHEDIPEFSASEQNPTIKSANECIKIETSAEFGRHVVATRDIQIGEVLCVEKPYACAVLTDEDKLIHCHTCLELCYNPIPCDKCRFLVFCSEDCKNQASGTFHKYECSTLATLFHGGVNTLDLIPTRIAVLAIQDHSSQFAQDEMYRSDRYKEISKLMTGIDTLKVHQLYQRAVDAACIFHIFLKRTSLFDNCTNNDIVKNQFKETVLLQIMVVDFNKLQVFETVTNLLGFEHQYFAHALYSFASLFNHSCCPNVESTQYGATTVLKTINSIKKGQQCFISYGLTYWNSNRPERIELLKSCYFFDCRCDACVKNWKYRGLLLDLQFPFFSCMSEVDALAMEIDLKTCNSEAARRYLPNLIEQLKRYEQFEPRGPAVKIRRLILICFKSFGNRRVQ